MLGGVTRSLQLTYLRPVVGNSVARITCELVSVGRRLALMKAEIRNAESGALCVIGEHDKVNTDVEVQKV